MEGLVIRIEGSVSAFRVPLDWSVKVTVISGFWARALIVRLGFGCILYFHCIGKPKEPY